MGTPIYLNPELIAALQTYCVVVSIAIAVGLYRFGRKIYKANQPKKHD